MSQHRELSIWFFIGGLLLLYGVLILGTGIAELYSPPAHPVVLAELHAPVWWGGLLVALGILYLYLYAPGRQK
jgi:hypothetical protein